VSGAKGPRTGLRLDESLPDGVVVGSSANETSMAGSFVVSASADLPIAISAIQNVIKDLLCRFNVERSKHHDLLFRCLSDTNFRRLQQLVISFIVRLFSTYMKSSNIKSFWSLVLLLLLKGRNECEWVTIVTLCLKQKKT